MRKELIKRTTLQVVAGGLLLFGLQSVEINNNLNSLLCIVAAGFCILLSETIRSNEKKRVEL